MLSVLDELVETAFGRCLENESFITAARYDSK